MKQRGFSFKEISVNQYLYQLKKNNLIYSAGVRWYSNINVDFKIKKDGLKNLVTALQAQFPFLEFNCWSIGQLKNYFHHLFTKDVTFIYTNTESLTSLNDYLFQENFNVYNNPGKPLVEEYFSLKEKTVVLRPSITEEPVDGYYSTIEKVLVDLLLEIEKLKLFERSEYSRLFNNIICSGRINVAKMLRYSQRRELRKIFVDDIFKSRNYFNCY